MAHPCAGPKPAAFCTRKKKARRKMDCSCPAGWERSGIMCTKGRQTKRAVCKKRRRK